MLLEAILRGLKAWLSFGSFFGRWHTSLAETVVDEQLERIENAKWSKEFLEQKELERNARRSRSGWRSANSQTQATTSVTLGRPGSGRKP
jgi:hypothetical protein